MVWIKTLILLSFSLTVWAKPLPKLLTKHPLETLKFITSDGRYAYTQKRAGVLGMVSSFRSMDFISEASTSDFIVKDSRFKKRLIIEVIPNAHTEYNLLKNHKIMVVDWGKTQTKDIGSGKSAKLHLQDEWISYFDSYERTIILQNVLTQKQFKIKRSLKVSPYFIPEVEMVNSDTVVYTDINLNGNVAIIQYNLLTGKSLLLKTNAPGSRIELCQHNGYLAVGEFPYDDINRGSKIFQIKVSSSTNLAGLTSIYSTPDADLGNIVCLEQSIYFVKTVRHIDKINYKQTEAVKLDLKSKIVQSISDLGAVSQLISMDDRVLIPFRGDYFVLEGTSDLSTDTLRAIPLSNEEELPLDL